MDSETGITSPGTDSPIACTLTNDEATTQARDWVELQHRCTEVEAIDDGARMTFPASLADEVANLVRIEAGCCAFLRIETPVIDDVLTLDISSPSRDALPVISALAGIPLS